MHKNIPNAKIGKYIAKGCPLAHPTVCFRKNVFEKINYSSTIRLNEDVDLWFKALKNGFLIDNLPDVSYRLLINSSFFKRRGYAKSFGEFALYMKGIWDLHKITWLYVFPIARLISRLMPQFIIKWAYNSSLRKRLLNK
jgi:hypothetical protein